MGRNWVVIGAFSGLLAVALGAFAAHALKSRLEPAMLVTFETAVRYQMYHALALVALGLLAERGATVWHTASGALFVAGTLLFSGTLYALTLSGVRWLGAITPLGGVAFIAGWLCLAAAAVKR